MKDGGLDLRTAIFEDVTSTVTKLKFWDRDVQKCVHWVLYGNINPHKREIAILEGNNHAYLMNQITIKPF